MAESDDDIIGPVFPRAEGRPASPRNDHKRIIAPVKEDNEIAIGPVLPAQLIETKNPVRSHVGTHETAATCFGPALPPDLKPRPCDVIVSPPSSMGECSIRPHLPSDDRLETSASSPVIRDTTLDTYGPALPPGFNVSSSSSSTGRPNNIIGPAFSSAFNQPSPVDKVCSNSEESSDSEEEVIGPMLPTSRDILSFRGQSALEELEARAEAMKNRLEGKDQEAAPSRDSWMTELPEFSKNFGMGPRTFRKHARPDEKDRSGWTETPVDRARKQQEREEKFAAEMMQLSSKSHKKKTKKHKEAKRSEEDRRPRQEEEGGGHRQTTAAARPESLLELHTKNRKRKMKEEGFPVSERRPFDRDSDLNVNRFDDARRKQLLKKSAVLDERFAPPAALQ